MLKTTEVNAYSSLLVNATRKPLQPQLADHIARLVTGHVERRQISNSSGSNEIIIIEQRFFWNNKRNQWVSIDWKSTGLRFQFSHSTSETKTHTVSQPKRQIDRQVSSQLDHQVENQIMLVSQLSYHPATLRARQADRPTTSYAITLFVRQKNSHLFH